MNEHFSLSDLQDNIVDDYLKFSNSEIMHLLPRLGLSRNLKTFSVHKTKVRNPGNTIKENRLSLAVILAELRNDNKAVFHVQRFLVVIHN